MKIAEDTSGASAPASTVPPVSGGPSPARMAMKPPKPPAVVAAPPPPRPLGGGGGMPSPTVNAPKLGSITEALQGLGSDQFAEAFGQLYQSIRKRSTD